MITTDLLIDHDGSFGALSDLMERQWPDWYNARGASARADLSERLSRHRLPLGIIAFCDGAGTCALTVNSGGLVTERSPWIGGLVVEPDYRKRGMATLFWRERK